MRGLGVILGTVAGSVALASSALAGYVEPPPGGGGGGGGNGGGEPSASVNAEGNPFTGGLGFDPTDVGVRVGKIVRWTNTDAFVPHTATEDNELWDLSGDYGLPVLFPTGFGPGESRQRAFDAGTFSYFCRVHPDDMRGVVRVPVRLSDRRKGKRKRFIVKARWGQGALPEGQVFDLQRRKGGRGWRTVRDGTRKRKGRFRGGRKGKRWSFRARVRERENPAAASGYSPVARIKVGR